MTTDIKRIANRLSTPQKQCLTHKAEWSLERQWMTFPQHNTHKVLIRRGIVSCSGEITPLGLAVRAYLMEKNMTEPTVTQAGEPTARPPNGRRWAMTSLVERLRLADCKLDGRKLEDYADKLCKDCLLYTSPSPRD